MVKHLAGAIALGCAMALLGGCATMVNGTTQRVQIDSIPPGADVAIDDSQHVITPAAVKLSRGHPHNLVFRKAGYHDASERLTSSMSGWILSNLVTGGVVGMAIDASDGAGRKLSADSVKVSLTPLPPGNASTASAHQAPLASSLAQSTILMRGLQTVVQPAGSTQPAAVPAASEGPPLDDFNDDEAGYARPATQAPEK